MLIEYTIETKDGPHKIGFGLDDEKTRECLQAIEYWKDTQLDNLQVRNKDWINYCHKQIGHIQEFMHKNG